MIDEQLYLWIVPPTLSFGFGFSLFQSLLVSKRQLFLPKPSWVGSLRRRVRTLPFCAPLKRIPYLLSSKSVQYDSINKMVSKFQVLCYNCVQGITCDSGRGAKNADDLATWSLGLSDRLTENAWGNNPALVVLIALLFIVESVLWNVCFSN